MPRLFRVAVALFLLGAAPADARPAATPGEASAMARDIQDGLSRWFPAGGRRLELHWEGPAHAAPGGEGIEVRLPELTVLDRVRDLRLVVGSIHLELVPAPDGTWRVGALLPRTMPVLGTGRRPVAELTVGSQHFAGVWSPPRGLFIELDARYADVALAAGRGGGGLRLAELTLSGRLRETARDRWGGPGEIVLRGLDVTAPGGTRVLSVDGLRLRSSVGGLDLTRAAPRMAEEQPLWTRLANIVDAASLDAQASGLVVAAPEGETILRVEGLGGGLRIDGLRGDLSSMAMDYAHAGLAYEAGENPAGAPFAPTSLQLVIEAFGLPNQALGHALGALLAEAPGEGAAASERVNAAVGAALDRAGSELRVKRGGFETAILGGTFEGILRAEPGSVRGAVGDFDLLLRGLDASVAMAASPGRAADPDAGGLPMMLSLLQVAGQETHDLQGRPARKYALHLAPDGRLLLNGADLKPLLDALTRP